MRRRDFITVLVGAAAYPRLAGAQQKAMPVIGFLHSGSAELAALAVAAFRQGLSETGYVEGQNVAIEYRWAEGRYDRLPAMAADFVDRKVDLIVAGGGLPSALAAENATSTIPIVFTSVGNPVGSGLVTGLARPGGNLTGFSVLSGDLAPKRLELLSELVPEAKLIALLVNPNNPASETVVRDVGEAARAKGRELHVLKAGSEGEIDAAFARLVEMHDGGLVVAAEPFFYSRRDQLVEQAERDAVPAIYELREYALAGGLISYGPKLTGIYRQVGIYAARILNGAKSADLPVQQPTTFELVVNLKNRQSSRPDNPALDPRPRR
jgi:putative ABC transport system substrate-binding protein